MEVITKDNMSNFYQSVVDDLKWQADKPLLDKMKASNEEKIKQLDESIKDHYFTFQLKKKKMNCLLYYIQL